MRGCEEPERRNGRDEHSDRPVGLSMGYVARDRHHRGQQEQGPRVPGVPAQRDGGDCGDDDPAVDDGREHPRLPLCDPSVTREVRERREREREGEPSNSQCSGGCTSQRNLLTLENIHRTALTNVNAPHLFPQVGGSYFSEGRGSCPKMQAHPPRSRELR
jgi:hypothetical protein